MTYRCGNLTDHYDESFYRNDIEESSATSPDPEVNGTTILPYTFETKGDVGVFAFSGQLRPEHEEELSLLLMKAIYGVERSVMNLKRVAGISRPCLKLLNKAYNISLRLKRPLIFTEVPRQYLSELFNPEKIKRDESPAHADCEHCRGTTGIWQGMFMGARNIAEAVVLQAIEDLWDPENRTASISFFNGYEFNICTELIGLNKTDKNRLIKLLEEYKNDRLSYLQHVQR